MENIGRHVTLKYSSILIKINKEHTGIWTQAFWLKLKFNLLWEPGFWIEFSLFLVIHQLTDSTPRIWKNFLEIILLILLNNIVRLKGGWMSYWHDWSNLGWDLPMFIAFSKLKTPREANIGKQFKCAYFIHISHLQLNNLTF